MAMLALPTHSVHALITWQHLMTLVLYCQIMTLYMLRRFWTSLRQGNKNNKVPILEQTAVEV